MLQKEVANKLKTTVCTYRNWEKNWRNPSIINIPKIIEFLNYIPWDMTCKNLSEKIIAYRKLHGLRQKDLARKIGVDPCAIGSWERDEHKPENRLLKKLDVFFSSAMSVLPQLRDQVFSKNK
jgi:transcriptional regulator with XRE-family HTH domain